MRVLVLGGGIIGTCSAWFLQQDGHEVALVDRQPDVALETSFANGGQISASHSEPWANPRAPLKLLRWLGREDAPLLLRLRADRLQWAWALAFLRECLPGRTRRNTALALRLALYSRALLKQMRSELGLRYDELDRGILHFYTDAREFEAARAAAAWMRSLGCDRRVVSASEALAIEPALGALADRLVGGDYCAEDESGDPHLFARALAQRLRAGGAHLLLGYTATRLLAEGDRVAGVELAGPDGWFTRHEADAIVVAAGVHSRALLAPLGVSLPVYPAKGYSATFRVTDPARASTVSLTDDQFKLVFSRLGDRLRVAGTAEFGAGDRALNPARCQALVRRARQVLPGACDYERPRFWSGLRPATPSNVPLIGRVGRWRNLYLNCGHGTLGWTMAAGSGRLIADRVRGRAGGIEWPEP